MRQIEAEGNQGFHLGCLNGKILPRGSFLPGDSSHAQKELTQLSEKSQFLLEIIYFQVLMHQITNPK
jgi:hypothetical protein